jgi:L-ascorbate metabolism protein UlaG (beta-lactamase superfamily)
VLTDPWFTERWYLHRGEPLGLPVAELPPLTAIVVSNAAPNHWDLHALTQYPHKATTPVYVSGRRMARQARAIGYRRVEVLAWHECRDLALALSIEAVPAGRTPLGRNNAYVMTSEHIRVFFGGEIQDVTLLQEYRARRAAIDVALLPTNGLRPLIGPPLVMGPAEAVAGAVALGAQTLVPVHDAHGHDPMSLFFRRHGYASEAVTMAPPGLDVVCLPTGQRWEYAR